MYNFSITQGMHHRDGRVSEDQIRRARCEERRRSLLRTACENYACQVTAVPATPTETPHISPPEMQLKTYNHDAEAKWAEVETALNEFYLYVYSVQPTLIIQLQRTTNQHTIEQLQQLLTAQLELYEMQRTSECTLQAATTLLQKCNTLLLQIKLLLHHLEEEPMHERQVGTFTINAIVQAEVVECWQELQSWYHYQLNPWLYARSTYMNIIAQVVKCLEAQQQKRLLTTTEAFRCIDLLGDYRLALTQRREEILDKHAKRSTSTHKIRIASPRKK